MFRLSKIEITLILFHLLVGGVALVRFEGALISYVFFTVAYCLLLLTSIRSKTSLAYMFLGIILWLGFWLKITSHVILSYPFVEPIGLFVGQPEQWDESLLVASIAAFGFVFSKILSKYFAAKDDVTVLKMAEVPQFYQKYRWALVVFVIASVVVVSVGNIVMGITMSGLHAVTVLPFKLNAISGWLLYIGFAIGISFLAHWEISSKKFSGSWFFLACFEGLCTSISIISRGLFLFHNLPIFLINFLNRKSLNLDVKRLAIQLCVFSACFVASSSAVTLLRSSLYGDLYLNTQRYSVKNIFQRMSLLEGKLGIISSQISGLTIDRWIGAEGVFSVISYPNKSFDLMARSIVRVPKVGEIDVYEEISKSLYPAREKYSFASIPGIVAFLYYPGQLWFVLFGMFLVGLLVVAADSIVFKFFGNAFLSAQISFYIANSVSQFGLSPRPLLVSFFMTICGLTFCYLLLNYFGSNFRSLARK